MLFGIAIDKGYIKNLDEKVIDFFPNYKIKKREKTIQHITIKNLLTMTAPYKYKSRACLKNQGSCAKSTKWRWMPSKQRREKKRPTCHIWWQFCETI